MAMTSLLHNYPKDMLWFSALLYALAFVFMLFHAMRGKQYQRVASYSIFTAAFIMQSCGLYLRGIELNVVPLTSTFEILQVTAWSTVFLILFLQILFWVRLLVFFGSALATIICWSSLILYSHQLNTTTPAIESFSANPWIEFHAILGIFAYGAFGICAMLSLMYLLQHYALTHKRFGSFFKLLPSLKQLEAVNRRILLVGVVILTLALSIGFLTWFGQNLHVTIGKLISICGLLICYTSLARLKFQFKIDPRNAAWISIFLFTLAILSIWPVGR